MSTRTSPQAPGAPRPLKSWATPFVQRFDQRGRTCNREGREVLRQYLMSMSSEWWKQVTTQMERILEVNALRQVTKAVVEAARESLVIGQG
jgi:hypothetical protein